MMGILDRLSGAVEPLAATSAAAGRRILWLLALIIALSLGAFPSSRADAACTVPNSISNGQVADATAVMDNFTALNDCVNSKVSPSGTPTAGSLPKFVGPYTITEGNLSGDCTTDGSLAVTCTKANGVPLGHFATGTDAGQLTGTVSVNRFDNGTNADASHFLRGDGVWAVPPTGSGGGSTNGTPTIRASNIQSSSASSYAVTWPAGTLTGDVVIIFGEHGWTLNVPAGWTTLDIQGGTNSHGLVIAKVMTAGDIAAGSVTVTATGTYNGVLAAVAIDGSTVTGLRSPGTYLRSSSGPGAGGSVGLTSGTPMQTDLILAFVGVRGSTNLSLSAGFTSVTSIAAAGASGTVGQFTGSLDVLGLNETATSSGAGSGYYTALVFVR